MTAEQEQPVEITIDDMSIAGHPEDLRELLDRVAVELDLEPPSRNRTEQVDALLHEEAGRSSGPSGMP